MVYVHKFTRLIFLLINIILIAVLHRYLSGSWVPTTSNITFIFQNLLLMVVFGSLLIESKFTKPADALVNSFLVLLTLLSVRDPTSFIGWNINVIYCLGVFVLSIAAMAIGSEKETDSTLKNRIAGVSYTLSTFFGKSNVIFSLTFLLSLFTYFSSQDRSFFVLLCFWAFVITAEPIGLIKRIEKYIASFDSGKPMRSGKVVGVNLPGFMKYEPYKDVLAKIGECVLTSDGNRVKILTVTDSYKVEDKCVAQAVCLEIIDKENWKGEDIKPDQVYRIGMLNALSSNDYLSTEVVLKMQRFIGVVIDNSNIGEITFKVSSSLHIEEGNVLEASIEGQQVLYQIVNARTNTETLLPEIKTAVVWGIAQQIGIWNSKKMCFEKYGWVPATHTPLFVVDKSHPVKFELKVNEHILGFIPNTNYPIIADVNTLITHHTALLGITGSGKTEMAFTLIEKMIALKAKVFCVDFTGDYMEQFKDLKPHRLSIDSEKAEQLNAKLLAAETGQYGAGKEINELEKFKTDIIPDIAKMVNEFVKSEDYLGVFELSEIVNTSATIAVTELYLSQIFAYAKEHRSSGQKFCIVLEEAHTVIPEAQTMGAQDKFSKATIGKISQIALQGRKYNVGLLVIAQRTANVTKTVLNQCNSIIVFNSYDKTGFDFLENYVGPGMISAIPNMKWLHSMVVGRGFKVGRPIIMSIPFKDKYKDVSAESKR